MHLHSVLRLPSGSWNFNPNCLSREFIGPLKWRVLVSSHGWHWKAISRQSARNPSYVWQVQGFTYQFGARGRVWIDSLLVGSSGPGCETHLCTGFSILGGHTTLDTQGLEVAISTPNLEGAEGSHRGHADVFWTWVLLTWIKASFPKCLAFYTQKLPTSPAPPLPGSLSELWCVPATVLGIGTPSWARGLQTVPGGA